MPKLISDVSNTTPFTVLPKNWYPLRIHKVDKTISKRKEDGTGGNPMLVFHHEVEGYSEEPRYNKKQVNYYNIVIGGKDRFGNPANLSRLFEYIAATGVPWDHIGCAEDMDKPPQQDKDKGIFLCPECGESLSKPGTRIAYDPTLFLGRRLKGYVDVKKREGTDEEQNELKRVRPLAWGSRDGKDKSTADEDLSS